MTKRVYIPERCPKCDSGIVVVLRNGLGDFLLFPTTQYRCCQNENCTFEENIDEWKKKVLCP